MRHDRHGSGRNAIQSGAKAISGLGPEGPVAEIWIERFKIFPGLLPNWTVVLEFRPEDRAQIVLSAWLLALKKASSTRLPSTTASRI